MKPMHAMLQESADSAFRAATLELEDDATRMVMLVFTEGRIMARRELPDGTSAWVDLSALLGKGDDVDAGVDEALQALWPEADGGTKRMMKVMANLAAKAGGLF